MDKSRQQGWSAILGFCSHGSHLVNKFRCSNLRRLRSLVCCAADFVVKLRITIAFCQVQTFRKFTTKVNLLILTDRLGFIPSAARLSSAGGSAAGVCCCWVAASKEEISLLFVCLNPLFLDVFPKILTKDFIFNWYYDPCTFPYLRIWNFILGMIYCVFIPILIIIIIIIIFVCIHTNFLWLSWICSEVGSSL